MERSARNPTQPLLLRFARTLPDDEPDCHYDPALRLNLTKDGVPVVSTAQGRMRLKTLGVRAED